MTRMPLIAKISDEVLAPHLQTNLGRALYNNPGLCLPFKALASGVHMQSHLEPRLREMVILRISSELKSDVEWGQHFRIATTAAVYGKVSISVAEARDIRDGKLGGFPLKERIALEFAMAVENNAVDDAAWDRVAAHFTPVEILDLTVLVTVYGMASRLTNALGVPMDDGILPISAVNSLL